MASNSNLKTRTTKFSKITLTLLLLVALWLQNVNPMQLIRSDHPEVMCRLGDNSITTSCRYGGYIINPNRTICKDRYVCYRGPGEACNDNDEMRCTPGLVCKCRMCMNCVDQNCIMELCPMENTILKRWIKRFERNLLDTSA